MSTNALARVAYREAGRATVCEVLYGPNVLKHAVIDAEAGEGEVVTFSGMPLPIDCRPPAGRRRGEQVGVVPDKLIDSHGVFAYAGIAAERIALRNGRFDPVDLEAELLWTRWFGAARRGREELSMPYESHSCAHHRRGAASTAAVAGRRVWHWNAGVRLRALALAGAAPSRPAPARAARPIGSRTAVLWEVFFYSPEYRMHLY